jgi:hypothetical protein
MRAYLALLLLALASCRESSTVESDAGISPPAVALAPSSVEGARPATSNTAQDAGAPPPSAPFQSKPTPEWNVDFFAVDVVGLVVRTRRVEVVSVGPVRDEDLLTGLPAGTIPGTTRTTFSDGSTYTVSEHKVAKRPYIATLDLKEGLSIEQGDMDLDGHCDMVREEKPDWSEVRWVRLRPGGPFETLTTHQVIHRTATVCNSR